MTEYKSFEVLIHSQYAFDKCRNEVYEFEECKNTGNIFSNHPNDCHNENIKLYKCYKEW